MLGRVDVPREDPSRPVFVSWVQGGQAGVRPPGRPQSSAEAYWLGWFPLTLELVPEPVWFSSVCWGDGIHDERTLRITSTELRQALDTGGQRLPVTIFAAIHDEDSARL
jgi:hypothetical protein